MELYYGVTGAGHILHTINPRFSEEQIRFTVEQADDAVIFFDPAFSKQAEAIAKNLLEMSRLRTPIVSVVIGEGGSGGALGIGVGDRVAMLEHAWYSVISPEGCAAILWKEANEKTNNQAAESLHLTASDNLKHGLVDAVIPEPVGGAHRDHDLASNNIQSWVLDQLASLSRLKAETLVRQRFEKFRAIGPVVSMALPEA